MHITRANDDPEFREMANAVRLRAEDMFQLEGRSVWCLPLKQIETTPSIGRLYFRFDKTKLSGIIQRRLISQPAKRITRRHGPDIMCFPEDTTPVGENQFIVAISLGRPYIQQDITSSTLKRRHEGDESGTEQETVPRRSENASSYKDVLHHHPNTDQDNDPEVAAKSVEQKKVNRITNDIAPITPKVPPELSPQWQAFSTKLRQEAEIVVSTLTDRADEPVELEVGDILELDASEYLHPKAGSVGAMFISYDWL